MAMVPLTENGLGLFSVRAGLVWVVAPEEVVTAAEITPHDCPVAVTQERSALMATASPPVSLVLLWAKAQRSSLTIAPAAPAHWATLVSATVSPPCPPVSIPVILPARGATTLSPLIGASPLIGV